MKHLLWKRLIASICAGLLICAVHQLHHPNSAFGFGNSFSSEMPFDSKKWKEVNLYVGEDTRYRMHKDLLRKYKLIGMSKEEVLDLLGPQSSPTRFPEWDLRYWMGPEPGIGIDSIWLVIKLKDDKVIDYKVVTD